MNYNGQDGRRSDPVESGSRRTFDLFQVTSATATDRFILFYTSGLYGGQDFGTLDVKTCTLLWRPKAPSDKRTKDPAIGIVGDNSLYTGSKRKLTVARRLPFYRAPIISCLSSWNKFLHFWVNQIRWRYKDVVYFIFLKCNSKHLCFHLYFKKCSTPTPAGSTLKVSCQTRQDGIQETESRSSFNLFSFLYAQVGFLFDSQHL